MNGESQERPPDGSEEAEAVEAGEPTHETEEAARARAQAEEKPDIDERESRISTRRKPMGPPLEEPVERAEAEAEPAEMHPPEEPSEPATDMDEE
jgi:hypothetical protein